MIIITLIHESLRGLQGRRLIEWSLESGGLESIYKLCHLLARWCCFKYQSLNFLTLQGRQDSPRGLIVRRAYAG